LNTFSVKRGNTLYNRNYRELPTTANKEANVGKKFDFEFATLGRDVIRTMADDELSFNVRKLRRMIKEAKKMGRDSLAMEIEYCYLDHEFQLRRKFNDTIHKGN
jgi:uncharacterized protein YdaL